MQCRRSRFLRARQDKIEAVNFTTPVAKHRRNLHGERCRGSCQLPLQTCRSYACALSSANVKSILHVFSEFHLHSHSCNEYICNCRRRDVAFQCAATETAQGEISVRADAAMA